MKYLNYVILGLLVFIAVLLKGEFHLSTDLLSLFASKDSIKKLEIATKLGYTRDMMIAVKGFDQDSKKRVDAIVKELQLLPNVEFVQAKTLPSDKIQTYYKEFYPILAEFNTTQLEKEQIKQKLQSLYNSQFDSFFYTPIDKKDPLKLFSLHLLKDPYLKNKNGYLTLGDYGYLIRVKTNVSPSNLEEAKQLYNDVHKIVDHYTNVIAFAGSFYTVENSQKIKQDISYIVIISTLLLFTIYFVFLKNFRLLLHTSIALASSMLFALIVSLSVYDNFHVISMAFGMSVSAVSIDYFFHYYFHNFYTTNKLIDKNVFYGYLTTTIAFGILSFIPVTLIAQISFFTALSLTFSYLLFTFVFKKLPLHYEQKVQEQKTIRSISSSLVFFVSVLLFGYVAVNFQLDNNIKSLDYQNKKLQAVQNLFQSQNKQEYIPVIVEAKSQKELLHNLHILKEDFKNTFSLASFIPEYGQCEQREKLLQQYNFQELKSIVEQSADEIGFKHGYFSKAYDFVSQVPSCSSIDLNIFKQYNLAVTQYENNYYTLTFVLQTKDLEKYPFVSSIDVKTLFTKVSEKMYKDIEHYGSIVLVIILLLIVLSVKQKFLYALNYILFPSVFVLSVLVSFYEINIMHIFALIILIAIGIDYGIYMSNTKKATVTMLAINYSLLSTFAAFGVLIFSSITALNSIGIVLSLGIGSIFILIKVMR
jgi:uncharacterized protein